jgi:adenosylmethionine-8-amino-7-oxononanoate aminotransferase
VRPNPVITSSSIHSTPCRPDIVTCGKGASSGYWPLGLCVASGDVYDTVTEMGTFSHGFTWSHHPIGAAVGAAVLEVIHADGLVERSRRLGEHVVQRLRSSLGDPKVGDIRGRGLLVACEFVADREAKTPFDPAERVTERVSAAALERGLTVYECTSVVDGSVGDAVLLGPPLSTPDAQLDQMLDRLVAAVVDTLAV